MSDKYKRFIFFYVIYSLIVFGLIYALSGCASSEPRAMGAMGECRALCRGDVAQFIDDTTQCICRERSEAGRMLK